MDISLVSEEIIKMLTLFRSQLQIFHVSTLHPFNLQTLQQQLVYLCMCTMESIPSKSSAAPVKLNLDDPKGTRNKRGDVRFHRTHQQALFKYRCVASTETSEFQLNAHKKPFYNHQTAKTNS